MDSDLLKKQQEFLSQKLEKKTILINGATGLVGSRIVFFLIELNKVCDAEIKLIALYRNEEKRKKIFASRNCKDVLFINHDIVEEFNSDIDVDYIIHCAGYSGGSKMHLKDPLKVFDIGVAGVRRMLDFASTHKCKGFLYVSTYEVYGNISKDELIQEDAPCFLDTFQLRNIYAEIKRFCESLSCAYASKYGFSVYAARLTSTFGKGVTYNDPRFFSEFARCIIENKNIILKSKGETVRSYLDVDDAATAFLYILANGESCNAYNITNMANQISIKDMALRLIEITNSRIELEFDVISDEKIMGFRKEGKTIMNAGKLHELGWQPVYLLDDTLLKLVDSMKNAKE